MNLTSELKARYSKTTDTAYIEFVPGLLRTTSFNYSDLIAVHFGRLPEWPPERAVPQGVTLFAAQEVRERLHGPGAKHAEEVSRELSRSTMSIALEEDVGLVTWRLMPQWDQAPFRIRKQVSEHIILIESVTGEPVGVEISVARGLDQVEMNAFFEALLEPLLLPIEDEAETVLHSTPHPGVVRFGRGVVRALVGLAA
jgi:hypothetical protein